jgi:hypothetical protein
MAIDPPTDRKDTMRHTFATLVVVSLPILAAVVTGFHW